MSHLKLIFLLSMIYMSFIGWSSNNWLIIWFIMEIIFLLFVGFALIVVNYGIVELIMKYFISQVFISLMFSSLVIFFLFNLSFVVGVLLSIVLCMKLGMFPFHFWFIVVLGKLGWSSFFLMMSLVKLMPILLLYYLSALCNLNFVLILSVIAGSVMGLCNTSIQKLLSYSSLVHLCWLLVSLTISIKVFMVYFICYIFMMWVFVWIFDCLNIYYLNQFKLSSGSFIIKIFIFFFILSFAGFPPFMGFLIKWVLVSFMLFFNMKILLLFMVIFTLFSVLFYLELFYYFMMIGSIGLNWYSYSLFKFNGVYGLVLVFYLFTYFII